MLDQWKPWPAYSWLTWWRTSAPVGIRPRRQTSKSLVPMSFWIALHVSRNCLTIAWALNESTLKLLVAAGKMRKATTVTSLPCSYLWKKTKFWVKCDFKAEGSAASNTRLQYSHCIRIIFNKYGFNKSPTEWAMPTLCCYIFRAFSGLDTLSRCISCKRDLPELVGAHKLRPICNRKAVNVQRTEARTQAGHTCNNACDTQKHFYGR